MFVIRYKCKQFPILRAIFASARAFTPSSQSSQHTLNITESRPKHELLTSPSLRPLPFHALAFRSSSTLCQRDVPSTWNPILFAVAILRLFPVVACQTKRRNPSPGLPWGSFGRFNAYCISSPTALVVTWVLWNAGRMITKPISVQRSRKDVLR